MTMFEIYLAIGCFGLGLLMGWSVGVSRGTELFRERVTQWIHETSMETGEFFAKHGLRGGVAQDGLLAIRATGALIVNTEDLLRRLSRSEEGNRTVGVETPAEFLDDAGMNQEPEPPQELLLVPSTALAGIIGPGAITATEAWKRVVTYAEGHGLRDGTREVRCDELMRTAFGVDSCNLFQLTKLVRDQLRPAGNQTELT